jgi:hypothetical protein
MFTDDPSAGPDARYECALAAALVILEMFETAGDGLRHHLLARTIFSILHAMDRLDEETAAVRGGEPSLN